MLTGRSCSAYPACGPEVAAAGGRYADIPVNQAIIDGKLVTAPAWPAHPDWLAKFLNVSAAVSKPDPSDREVFHV